MARLARTLPDERPEPPLKMPKGSVQLATGFETRTSQLDPTELARLVGKTMPEPTHAAIVVHPPTEESLPIEMPLEMMPLREDDRATGEMAPTEIQDLRDQTHDGELAMRTTELDPSVLRAMMGMRESRLPPRSVAASTTRWGSAWNVSELAERAITDAIEPLRKSWASEWSTAEFELRARTEMMEPLARPDAEGDDLTIAASSEQPVANLEVPAAPDADVRALDPRERRRHAEQRPFTRPPPVTAPIAEARTPKTTDTGWAPAAPNPRMIKTDVVRPLTRDDDYAPPAFAWRRALLIAAAIVAIVVGFALTR
jgi:hypothetical protein